MCLCRPSRLELALWPFVAVVEDEGLHVEPCHTRRWPFASVAERHTTLMSSYLHPTGMMWIVGSRKRMSREVPRGVQGLVHWRMQLTTPLSMSLHLKECGDWSNEEGRQTSFVKTNTVDMGSTVAQ